MSTQSMHFGTIDQAGSLKLKDNRWFREVTSGLAGKNVCFTIREAHVSASGPQFRYYRGVVLPLFMDGMVNAGYEPFDVRLEELHVALFSRYAKCMAVDLENIESMPRKEFSAYVEMLQRIACQFLDVIVPDPNQKEFL